MGKCADVKMKWINVPMKSALIKLRLVYQNAIHTGKRLNNGVICTLAYLHIE